MQDFKNGQIDHTSIGGPKIIEFESETDPSKKNYLQVEVFKHPSKEMYTVYIKNLENGKIKILTCNHYGETSYHYTNEGANLEIAKVQGNTLESTNPPNKQQFVQTQKIGMDNVRYFISLKDSIPNVSVSDVKQVVNMVPSENALVFQENLAQLSR